jgi:hypothetical protein
MELDPKYVEVIIKRWEEHSGLVAEMKKQIQEICTGANNTCLKKSYKNVNE